MISRILPSDRSYFIRTLNGNSLSRARSDSPNEATLRTYDLLHFANELLAQIRDFKDESFNEILEAINPNSNGKKLEAIFKYGNDVLVSSAHLRRTILLSSPFGKTAVERDPRESDELFRVLKVYLTSSVSRAAA